MEKLTEYVDGKYIRIKGTKSLYPKNERDGAPLSNAIARLAAYEETGLEPEELAQAKKKGRLVVLPCKVGDTVYHITTCEYFPQVLDGTMYGSDGGPGTATGFYCPCELAENCPFDADDFDCNINKKKFAVFEDEVVSLCINDCEMRVELGYSGYVDVSDFGKTVFLTREAAEAALDAMGGENNA